MCSSLLNIILVFVAGSEKWVTFRAVLLWRDSLAHHLSRCAWSKVLQSWPHRLYIGFVKYYYINMIRLLCGDLCGLRKIWILCLVRWAIMEEGNNLLIDCRTDGLYLFRAIRLNVVKFQLIVEIVWELTCHMERKKVWTDVTFSYFLRRQLPTRAYLFRMREANSVTCLVEYIYLKLSALRTISEYYKIEFLKAGEIKNC